MPRFIKALVVALLCTLVAGFGVLIYIGRRGIRPRPSTPVESRPLDGSGRTVRETEAVLRAARGKARPATDRDAEASDARRDMDTLYSDYHPYFVRGDLNGDGVLDFAQAFVEERNGGLWFDVAVFFGRPDGTFEEPVYVERSISLARGDLSIDRSLLLLTPDLSDEGVRRWRYEPREKRFVDADAAPHDPPEEEDAPEERPDGKLETRA